MKLIRVMEGVYRSDDGGVKVFYRPWIDKDFPWVMTWVDTFCCRTVKRFRTLKDARAELKDQ